MVQGAQALGAGEEHEGIDTEGRCVYGVSQGPQTDLVG